jgi:hypothetical protein
MTPIDFAVALMAYCSATRGSVTSWGRTERRNGQVGGHVSSWHLSWLGADVVYDSPVPKARAKLLASRHGLRLVREGDHDHLQPETM